MRITISNHKQYGPGTLIRAFEEMDQFESDNPEEEADIIELQSAISRTLEGDGWTYSEEDNEWVYIL